MSSSERDTRHRQVARLALSIASLSLAWQCGRGAVFPLPEDGSTVIGENSSVIRARIVEKLAWLDASLDSEANAANALL